MVSPADSLIFALTDIGYGVFFLSLAKGGIRTLSKVTLLVILTLMLLSHVGIYLNTGWDSLQTGSRMAMAAMIAVAMWRYATRTLAVDEEKEEEEGSEAAPQ